jgi:acyl-CoA thioester hydrolase
MEQYIKPIELRWSDLDPNFHLRHSAYYDFGAYARIAYLEAHGLSTGLMKELKFGPILFREECVFRKEIRLGDEVTINVQLSKARPDFSRWSIQHEFNKNGQHAALLTVDGAWLDTELRKLAPLPEQARPVFEGMPRAENFEWIVK